MDKRRILCFGDSNTHGVNPVGPRFGEAERWPTLLQSLLGERFRTMPGLTPVPDMPNVMTIPELKVAGMPYANLTAVLSDITPIQKKVPVEGVVGYQVLSAQRSMLDFRGQRLLLEE